MVAFIDKYDFDGIEVDWETAVTFRFEGSKQRLDGRIGWKNSMLSVEEHPEVPAIGSGRIIIPETKIPVTPTRGWRS